MANTLALVRETLAGLTEAGFAAAVFGGWAEELHGLSQPRPHSDIDLTVVDPSLPLLDAYVQLRGEIATKRQSHKRAYIAAGVLVELFIVGTRHDRFVTTFWDTYEYDWPPLGPVEVNGLRVVTTEAVTAYPARPRLDHRAPPRRCVTVSWPVSGILCPTCVGR